MQKLLSRTPKLLLTLALTFVFPFSSLALAETQSPSPTVQVVSYQKLSNGQLSSYGWGSGTLIDSEGHILSNHHVIFDNYEQKALDTFAICLSIDSGQKPQCRYTAHLIAHNKDRDLSLLKLNDLDVFGEEVPALPYLAPQETSELKDGDPVNVVGFPGSGGDNITFTEGVISGSETSNEFLYWKTDSQIDFGNSGGTALNSEGEFVGIPTFIRSLAETTGYFLDSGEAVKWLNQITDQNPLEPDTEAEETLRQRLAQLEKANQEKTLSHPAYPAISATIPDNWEFERITEDHISVQRKNHSQFLGLDILINRFPHLIDQTLLDEINKNLAEIKEWAPDYRREDVELGGAEGFEATYTHFGQKNHLIYLPYGDALVTLSYSLNVDEEESQAQEIQAILDSISFEEEKHNEADSQAYLAFEDPDFSLSVPQEQWRMLPYRGSDDPHLMLVAQQQNNVEGLLSVHYRLIPKNERNLSAEERLEALTKNLAKSGQLFYSKEDLKLGGLSGFGYGYQQEGDDFGEKRKTLSLVVYSQDHEFLLSYDDLAENFDKNIQDLESIFSSLIFGGAESQEYDLGSLANPFSDIDHHPFEANINSLYKRGAITGYPDGSFRPEQAVQRVEGLTMILRAKNHLEQKKKSGGKPIDFISFAQSPPFNDADENAWYSPFVGYAYQKQMVQGYEDGTLKPEQEITLGEALKWVLLVFEAPLWNGETQPWYAKYMGAAYSSGLLPRGLDDPNQALTRAELAVIVDRMYDVAE